jgi:4-amino-4-deoxy-L-arabinose transferase-like glycosyltransferase
MRIAGSKGIRRIPFVRPSDHRWGAVGKMAAVRRRLLNFLTLLSLLLCVAVCALWAWTYDTWRVGTRPGQIVLFVTGGGDGQGELYVRQTLKENAAAGSCCEFLQRHASASAAMGGFEYHRGTTPTTGMTFPFTILAVPVWSLLLMTLTLPAACLRLARRHRRRERHGQCPRCGYDLRATPDRCPECGAVP